jgi:hypothetical protein
MTDDDDHITHAALCEQLATSIERLRVDIESRSDPILEEIANAMDVILQITTHAHDHAVENSRRLKGLGA